MSLSGPFWALFGPYYASLTAYRAVLGLSETYWSLLGHTHTGSFAILGNYEVIWAKWSSMAKKHYFWPITIIFVYIWGELGATNCNLYDKMGS